MISLNWKLPVSCASSFSNGLHACIKIVKSLFISVAVFFSQIFSIFRFVLLLGMWDCSWGCDYVKVCRKVVCGFSWQELIKRFYFIRFFFAPFILGFWFSTWKGNVTNLRLHFSQRNLLLHWFLLFFFSFLGSIMKI